jgi:Kef-type K+ transport system membrane component KefB
VGLAAVVPAVAVIGTWGACSAAARLSGESPKDAATIGVLMNARGLMELIILDVGLERGVITPTLFTTMATMATMAIVTTLMTSPLANRLLGPAPDVAPGPAASAPSPRRSPPPGPG